MLLPLTFVTRAAFDSPSAPRWEVAAGRVRAVSGPCLGSGALLVPAAQVWDFMLFLILLAFLSRVANQSSSLVDLFVLFF